MLDDLVELVQFSLLVFVELLYNQLLGVHAVANLLLELLQGCLHPVTVVLGRTYRRFLQLLFDVTPDLAHLEVWIHLDHL